MDTHTRASSGAGSRLGITRVLTEEVGERRKPGGRRGQGCFRLIFTKVCGVCTAASQRRRHGATKLDVKTI